MAGDVVTSRTLVDGRQFVVLLTNVSDGTGESAVVKVDLSALTDLHGDVPTAIAIDHVQWSISGFQWVKLAFAHTNPDTALVLANGSFKWCFRKIGGIRDPGSDGGTGDLTLTTGPATADGVHGTYTIAITLRKV